MPGKADFAVYCAACHHAEGLGVKGGGPPLASSPWVAGPEARLIRIVLHGVRGPLTVGNVTYNLEMPGFGSILDDAQVAALVSFARRKFGGVHAPTTPRAVRRVRGETRGRTGYWTAEELLDLR
jgi:mono/diheme cytochrome c family protein